jgi:cell division protein FtsQ
MNMKRPVKIALIISSVLLLAVLVVVANVLRSHMRVRGIEVVINYAEAPQLVNQKVVADTLMDLIPDLMQKQVRQVDCRKVANAALHVPFLTRVSVSVSISGKVVVQADQRRPVARLFFGNSERYIDVDGKIIPTSDLGDCNVVVATGDFAGRLNSDSVSAQIKNLWQVALFLDGHAEYSPLVDQLHVQRNGEVLMVPKVGDQIIELGDTSGLENKFADLLAFYRNGMPRAGWHTYSRISLKFKDQVVCTKR